ncbi:MAG: hypothetical protein D6732_18205, partial [Methanobacteriota archaeon]
MKARYVFPITFSLFLLVALNSSVWAIPYSLEIRGVVSLGEKRIRVYIDAAGTFNNIKWSFDELNYTWFSTPDRERINAGIPVEIISADLTIDQTNTLYLEGIADDGTVFTPHFTFYHEINFINSLKSWTILTPIQNDSQIDTLSDKNVQLTVSYADAMGRSLQTINVKASPQKKDVVTPVAYDQYGLQSKTYLAYVANQNNGQFRKNAITEQDSFYNAPPPGVPQTAAPYAFSKTLKTPDHRAVEQGAVGEAWQPNPTDFDGHTVKSWTLTNTANEVRKWDENLNPDGYYAPGELTVTKTVDENGRVSYEYKDKSDQTILKKSNDGTRDLFTYYVYDNFGNLRYIIPPAAYNDLEAAAGAITDAMKQRWVTEFTYDSQNRLIEKKIPEAEAIYTVYDRLGRVVLTQDGNLRAQNRWMFTKYDVHGRTILTGVYTDPNGYDRAQMQAHLDQVIDGSNTPGHYAYYETPDANGAEGYTDNAFPPIGDCQ